MCNIIFRSTCKFSHANTLSLFILYRHHITPLLPHIQVQSNIINVLLLQFTNIFYHQRNMYEIFGKGKYDDKSDGVAAFAQLRNNNSTIFLYTIPTRSDTCQARVKLQRSEMLTCGLCVNYHKKTFFMVTTFFHFFELFFRKYIFLLQNWVKA